MPAHEIHGTRRRIFVGNWKLNLTAPEARALVIALRKQIDSDSARIARDRDIVVAPPSLALPAVAQELAGSSILLAAQNMYCEDRGAFTGEASAPMLKVFGVTHVIVGHSERRNVFHEDDDLANRKLRAALHHRLTPILCVGEHLADRERGHALEVVLRQVERGLSDVDDLDVPRVVIAYEPVWAIGTGRSAKPTDVELIHGSIRGALLERYGREVAHATRIVYGGSVTAGTIDAVLSRDNVDGVIVGGASLQADSFAQIIKSQIAPL